MPTFDSSTAIPLGARNELLNYKGHICGLFQSEDEKYQTLATFMKDAMQQGERAHHVIDPARRADHIDRLARAGIDAAGAIASGQLTVRGWPDIYFEDGEIDHGKALSAFTGFSADTLSQGYPRTQFISHMEWATCGDLDELVEYEAAYELYASESLQVRDVVICCYDLTKWTGDLVMRTLRTHPLVIVGGVLHENPFFTSPRDMMEEIKSRRAARCDCDHQAAFGRRSAIT